MDTKELEALDPLHFDVNGGVFGPPFPVVHDQILCLAHIEGEVVVLAPHCQVSDLPIGRLIVVGDQAVVSSANLMRVLVSCLATQSWVNKEYSKGLSSPP